MKPILDRAEYGHKVLKKQVIVLTVDSDILETGGYGQTDVEHSWLGTELTPKQIYMRTAT